MQNFNVDISTSHIPQVLYVKQGDSLSRFFALTIADNGSPWEPPENAAYTIRFSTSAGTGWYDTIQLVGGTTRPAVSAAGNVLTCEVAEQSTLGNGQLCVMVNDATGYQLGTWNLNIITEVVPGANSQEAESYYGVLAGQIAQALAAEQGATEQANLAKQYADSIDPSQFATQAELDATQAELDATQAQLAAKTTGHVIQNPDGTAMTQRANLKFAGDFSVVDDPSGDATVVSPKTLGGTQNVAGYVGEISLFADNQLRENHVWADGSTINPDTWPDLAAYAATAGWETDSGTGWYKTPNLQGCFLLPSSSDYAVNTTGGEKEHTHTYGVRYGEYYGAIVDGIAAKDYPTGTFSGLKSQATKAPSINSGLTAQKNSVQSLHWLTEAQTSAEPTMPPYYVVTAQIRAKVDIITTTAVEVNGNTLGGFEDGQVLAQQGGKIVGKEITAASLGAVQPYQAGDIISYGTALLAGRATTANVQVTIPLSRPCTATTAEISGRCTIRGADATTLASNVDFSATAMVSANAITATIPITYGTEPTNYTLVSVLITSMTITLS